MVQRNKRGYLTREDSVKFARRVRLNPQTVYTMVHLTELSTGRESVKLFSTHQLGRFYHTTKMDNFKVITLAEDIKWNHSTQMEVAKHLYFIGYIKAQERQQGSTQATSSSNRATQSTVEDNNKKDYPIKTKKGLFIGDPCYVIPDEQWSDYVDAYLEARGKGHAHFNFNGVNVGGTNTAYGDGEYSDGEWNSYPVDAGLIGVTPLELLPEVRIGMGLVIQGEFEARIEYNDGDIEIYINGRNPIIISTKEEGGYY